MKLNEFIEKSGFELVTEGDMEGELSEVFCCDLLSFAMTKNPAGSVWVTVMGNVNTVAVAVLTEGGCIVVAEGAEVDENAIGKARMQGVCILKTDKSVFKAALEAHYLIS
ncbi:MAG: hypothetical protein E7509_03640 [Ruminococcus sp.]|nr:hypothetical protein [Ruminococcus sp.]